MFEKLKIVNRLFKYSFLMIAILYFLALTILLMVMTLKDSYKRSLENEFATKQPHIKISYINNDVSLNGEDLLKEKNYIKNLSNLIYVVSEYSSDNKFVNLEGIGINGERKYQGNVKIIGFNPQDLVYDFFSSEFNYLQDIEGSYTPLTFLFSFNKLKNGIVTNASLYDSFYPSLSGVEIIKLKKLHKDMKLLSKFYDFDKHSIIYTNIKFANQILGRDLNHIDGFLINVKNLKDIDKVSSLLKLKLDSKKYLVVSWLEEKQKQNMMFSLFKILSFVIVFVVLMLSLLFIFLLIYNSVVKKSYQLSVLSTLGYILKKEIFLTLLVVILFEVIGLILGIIYFTKPLLDMFSLPYDSSIVFDNSIYVLSISTLFLIVTYLIVDNVYKLNVKNKI